MTTVRDHRQDLVGSSAITAREARSLRPGVSVVVPVFRSSAMLDELHRRLTNVLGAIETPYEIILVEDGGEDESWERIKSLALQDPAVRGIRMRRNFGQHNAILCGLRAARHEVAVTLDDDLQNPPEEIPTLLRQLSQGHDVVYGTPSTEMHGVVRDLASRITKLALQSVMGAETARHVSAFRALRTPVRDAFAHYRGPFVTIDVLLTWGTAKFSHIAVRHEARASGTSNYTVRALIGHAFNMMTGFSTLPLQVASLIGFVFTIFGFAVLAYVLGSFVVYGSAVPGFAFLASIIAIFSGAQLFALGIIGEYLARVHFRSMDRPTYVIQDDTEQVGPPGE